MIDPFKKDSEKVAAVFSRRGGLFVSPYSGMTLVFECDNLAYDGVSGAEVLKNPSIHKACQLFVRDHEGYPAETIFQCTLLVDKEGCLRIEGIPFPPYGI